MSVQAAATSNDFSGGFKAGFPPTAILRQPVDQPTTQYSRGQMVGGVAGIGTGALSAKLGAALHRTDTVRGLRKFGGFALMGLGIGTGALGLGAIVSAGFDMVGRARHGT